MSLTHEQMVDQIDAAVSGWAGVESAAHRFGGVEWRLGRVEIGHAHRVGLVDVPYTVAISRQLVAEGKAEPHHILPDSGWISFYVRQDADVERALWLLRLSYVHKGRRRLTGLDVAPLIETLDPSQALRGLLAGGTGNKNEKD
jgi:hypothetical protein